MEDIQGREEIPLRDFNFDNYDDTSGYWDNQYDETNFDYNEEEFGDYEKKFDWSNYNEDQLTKTEKDTILKRNFRRDISLREKYNQMTSNDTKRIIETIDDEKIRKNLIETIVELDDESDRRKGKLRVYELRDLLVNSIDRVKFSNEIDNSIWDNDLNLEDHEKFYYQQKINNLNQAIEETFIDFDNDKVVEFIDSNLITNIDFDNNRIIIGYKFNDFEIVSLDLKKGIYVENKSPQLSEFINKVEKLQESSARSIFARYLESNDTQAIKTTAREYIAELRENQKKAVEDRVEGKATLKKIEDAIADINAQNKVIDDIKKKKGFFLKLNSIRNTIGRSLRYIFKTIRKNPFVFTGALLSVVGSLVSLILGIEETKRIVHSIQKHIPNAVKEGIQGVLTPIFVRYLLGSPGQSVSRSIAFRAVESLAIGFLTLIVALGSLSYVIVFITSGILYLFGIPIGFLEYIQYNSCLIVESQYTNSGTKTPHNIAETIAKFENITLEKYYEKQQQQIEENKPRKNSPSLLNILAPLARINISVVDFVIRNHQLVVGVVSFGLIYSIYKIVLYLRHNTRNFPKLY